MTERGSKFFAFHTWYVREEWWQGLSIGARGAMTELLAYAKDAAPSQKNPGRVRAMTAKAAARVWGAPIEIVQELLDTLLDAGLLMYEGDMWVVTLREAFVDPKTLKNDAERAARAATPSSPQPKRETPPPGKPRSEREIRAKRGRTARATISADQAFELFAEHQRTPEVREALTNYLEMRREKKGHFPWTPTGARVKAKQCSEWTADELVRNLVYSTGNHYDGIFEDRGGRTTAPRVGNVALKTPDEIAQDAMRDILAYEGVSEGV